MQVITNINVNVGKFGESCFYYTRKYCLDDAEPKQ